MLLNLKYIECPHCKKWYSRTELISYNTFGSKAECWSDGKCINSNISEYSFLPFSKCDNCNQFFWFDECRQLEDYEIKEFIYENKNRKNETDEEVRKLVPIFLKENKDKYISSENMDLDYPPPHYWLDLPVTFISDLLELLKSEILNLDSEIFIRIKLWQHINDLRRNRKIWTLKQILNNIKNRNLYYKYKSFHTSNMEKLLKLIEKSKDSIDKFPLLVELYRELGDFQKAKSIINNADASEIEHNKEFITKSRKMIENRNKKIFKI